MHIKGSDKVLKLIDELDMNFDSIQDFYSDYDEWSIRTTPVKKGAKYYYDYACSDLKIGYNFYYLIDDNNPNYIIGFGSIGNSDFFNYRKNNLNGGNIDYGIRVSERKKGYGMALFRLLLQKCEEFGMTEVCISCHEINICSKKIIEKNGGVFEKKWLDSWHSKQSLKYWIKLPVILESKVKSMTSL